MLTLQQENKDAKAWFRWPQDPDISQPLTTWRGLKGHVPTMGMMLAVHSSFLSSQSSWKWLSARPVLYSLYYILILKGSVFLENLVFKVIFLFSFSLPLGHAGYFACALSQESAEMWFIPESLAPRGRKMGAREHPEPAVAGGGRKRQAQRRQMRLPQGNRASQPLTATSALKRHTSA